AHAQRRRAVPRTLDFRAEQVTCPRPAGDRTRGREPAMQAIAIFVRAVDALNEAVGRVAAWLTLATVLICAVVVVMRYAFSSGFIWLQELFVWTYACVFMLGAGYTLLHDGHVRVDIFYARAGPRARAIVNLFGVFVFLLP